eukprot:123957_1
MLSFCLFATICCHLTQSSSYKLTQSYSGTTFFNGFEFLKDEQCVHSSFSNFITNISQAYEMGIINTTNNSAYIGTDYTTIFPSNSTIGRASICIGTKQRYKTGLFILDASHMPFGCGTWPSWWLTDGNYHANNSEYDTLEGVNLRTNDVSAFHTKSSNCSFSSVASNTTYISQSMSGTWKASSNCSFYAQHCSIYPANNSDSYGQLFNNKNGGVFATEIYLYPNNDNATQYKYGFLRTWFWTRNEIPMDIKNKNPEPSTWKLPYANWPFGATPHIVNNGCSTDNINTYHQLRFDLYYCGVAGGKNSWSMCQNVVGINQTCEQFVNQNASYFKDAYWLINYMDVYHL